MRRNLKFAVLLPGVAALAQAGAATLDVSVQDRDGRAVQDVVITVTVPGSAPPLRRELPLGVVDQIDEQFVPEVLVIQVGASVVFPNSDRVAHQVYSFSPPKRFALGLYRGHPHPPVLFDKPGLVILGCNIHDHMVGYILVADTPYFAKTDARGVVQLEDLPARAVRVTAWGARFANDEPALARDITLTDAASANVSFRLTQALRSAAHPRRDSRERDY